jgi:hypothetical protein
MGNGVNGHRPATLDHLRSKKAIRVPHKVLLDNELARALNEARTALEEAQAGSDVKAVEAAGKAYDAARDAAAAAEFSFLLKAVPGHQFDKLSRQHRVTEEDRAQMLEEGMTAEQIDRVPQSPTSWPPVIIAATVDDPKMTPEEVRELIWENDEWNQQERYALLLAVQGVNNGQGTVDLGKAFGGTSLTKGSKRSPTGSASPAASS